MGTPIERAADDYAALVRRFAPLADYLAINISSPNTEGLRRLQARETMAELLGVCIAARPPAGRTAPMLVKLAPDLALDELDDAVEVPSGTSNARSAGGARSPRDRHCMIERSTKFDA